MGTFNANFAVDRYGNLKSNLQFSGVNLVDRHGNLKSSAQFLSAKCPDRFGNLGTVPASGPWEVQVGTVETVGQDLSRNTTNYATTITTFASAGCTGFMDGIVSGGGNWTVQGGPQTIGGVSYAGGGTIVATKANNINFTVVQVGAVLQLGETLASTTGSVYQLQNSGVVNAYGANTTAIRKMDNLNNTAGGVVNVQGPDVCGQGVIQNFGYLTNNGTINIDDAIFSTSNTGISGTGVINVLDGGTLQTNNLPVNNSQTVNINGCGWCNASGQKVGAIAFTASNYAMAATVNVQTASCINLQAGISGIALNGILKGSAPLLVSSAGATPTQTITFGSASNTYNGELTVSNATLILASTSLQYARVVLERAARISGTGIIGSLASDDQTTYWVQASGNSFIKSNGDTTFAGRFIGDGVTARNHWLEGGAENILRLTHNTTTGGHTATVYARNGSKLVLESGTKFTGETGQLRISLGSTLSSDNTTSSATYIFLDTGAILDVQAISPTTASKITATKTINSTGGYKVNVPAGLVAGSYPILQANAGGTIVPQLPTINQNLSGLTATFAWNNAVLPRVLNMTLA